MSLILRLLPIVLISFIFYFLAYNLYPSYQELISLAKEENSLKNKKAELESLIGIKNSLSQGVDIKQFLSKREVINLWIPTEPKIEELIAFLTGIYQAHGLVFKGTQFAVAKNSKSLNPNILPIGVVSFNLQTKLNYSDLVNFIKDIENSARIISIKKASLVDTGEASMVVESYFVSTKKQ
jgi:Tfp pilus assembly protein PilO